MKCSLYRELHSTTRNIQSRYNSNTIMIEMPGGSSFVVKCFEKNVVVQVFSKILLANKKKLLKSSMNEMFIGKAIV